MDSFRVIWDSGASQSVTFDKRDFVPGSIRKLPRGASIKGIANNLRIEGIGKVMWSVLDTKGNLTTLCLPAYYIPKLHQRLLSISSFTQTYPDSTITVTANSWTISKGNKSIDIHIDPRNNLPTSTCFRKQAIAQVAANLGESVVHLNNQNLNEPQKELLRWHYRLGHAGFRTIQMLMKSGVLAATEGARRLHTAASKLLHSDLPKCSACQFGRQTSRPIPSKRTTAIRDRAGILSADQTQPGQLVFIDHFVCTTRGRKFSGFGKGNKVNDYKGGCIFVDASSGFIHVEFQTHLNSYETLQAIQKFEALARDSGIIIQKYQSDNGSAFTSAAYKDKLELQGQTAQFSSAGSHHQNGRAERGIRTTMAMARTMLLHQAINWPDVADSSLWPCAVRYAAQIYNLLPNSTHLSPTDVWTKSRIPLRQLHKYHVFGCPVYVLQKRLADGKKLGRWEPRSQRCIHMGFSPDHSKDAPLVLNPATGSLTPQWNMVYDDSFSTISSSIADLPDFTADSWHNLFGTHTCHIPMEETTPLEETTLKEPPQMYHRSEILADSTPSQPLNRAELPATIPATIPATMPCSSNQPTFQEERKNSSERMSNWNNSESPTENFENSTFRNFENSEKQEKSIGFSSLQNLDKSNYTPSNVSTNASRYSHASISPIGGIPGTPTGHPSNFPTVGPSSGPTTTPTGTPRKSPTGTPTGTPTKGTNPLAGSRITKISYPSPRHSPTNTPATSTTSKVHFNDTPTYAETAKPSALKQLVTYNNPGTVNELPTRSKRQPKPRKLLNYKALGGMAEINGGTDLGGTDIGGTNLKTELDEEWQLVGNPSMYLGEVEKPLYMQLSADGWIYLAKKKSDPDLLTWDQAMRDFDNLSEWTASLAKEIKQLEDKGCWVETTKDEAMTSGQKIIPCTWVLRLKRNPAGDVIKLKARICLRGDLMNQDEDNFAPVVAFSTVRFFLVASMIMGWTTLSADWSNAFTQATLKEPIYMAIPRGFKSKFGSNGVLKLLKSLYGSRLAPKTWYQHLRSALINDLKMKESPIDPCLLYRDNLLMILYVDDAGLAAPNRSIIEEFVQELKDLNFDLQIENEFSEYLGIGIEQLPDGSRHMTQKGLIKKILLATDMENCKPNWCPAKSLALGSDPDGEPFNENFSYSSVVGMLLYLSNNTRIDITYAVSQVARFTHNPKQSHGEALKMIVRYLAKTQDKGLIVKPSKKLTLHAHVDADFSGLHGREPQDDPNSARSRYGYIICFNGIPLVWKSQLIKEICQSTLHSEYVGLSYCCRALIPMRELILDVPVSYTHLTLPTKA